MKIGNLEVYGIIYKIKNLVDGKIYIGQTIQKRGFKDRYDAIGEGIERVFNYYMQHINRGKFVNYYIFNAINKYGIDSFEVSEIFDVAFSQDELNIKEQFWISYYNSNDRNFGYNIASGGNNSRMSEETKEKLKNIKLGTKMSNEFKVERSKQYSGSGNPNYGKKHSKETRELISKNNRKYWNNIPDKINHNPSSEETKKKLSESHIGLFVGEKCGKAKLSNIQVEELKLRYINEFISAEKLSQEYDTTDRNIVKILKGISYFDVRPDLNEIIIKLLTIGFSSIQKIYKYLLILDLYINKNKTEYEIHIETSYNLDYIKKSIRIFEKQNKLNYEGYLFYKNEYNSILKLKNMEMI